MYRFSFDSLFLKYFVGKKQPHSNVLAGFPGPNRVKGGKNRVDLRAFGDL
jgi:hypothetical protein